MVSPITYSDHKYLATEQNSRNEKYVTRTWANAQRDGRPAKHRWRPLFNVEKFG